ncbi:hypothetical protein [Candidatus Symbiobacter mobilis]|uniref:Uncharacterized protein n=1 Tax=Candidatus Symbiobacter mobilis CR TaxID=946483 RepID=U5NES3_9BURK|nr:hypothetical protein [Candidatus Symbiobacter mobilis]AGX88738.1 hypothetical protein Cenrod_2688 [Candidatus Symbiobacter mobilis CR]
MMPAANRARTISADHQGLEFAERCVVRRVSGRVTNYKDAEMAPRWTAAGFLEAVKSCKKLRGHADLKILINSLRPVSQQVKKAA